ncbi:MAG: prolipoprotein diacylglyceryl transferase [Candidatus Melainabacteria bacterium]|nr:prolipoprotein diacylglyceryl transferase [Candidatus Melainabacteria bacterium]
MEFQSPGPFLSFGAVSIRWYALCTALGFVASTFAAVILLKRWGCDYGKSIPAWLTFFIGGLVGARAYYVVLCWQRFFPHPEEIFSSWGSGRSIHGGVIGGVITAAIYCRLFKFPFLVACDALGATIPLGQAIGRWGNFFNSEAFGSPVAASYPLKLLIPASNRPFAYRDENFFHPTFLYESAWNLAIFLFLYFFAAQKLRPYPGACFLCYVILYSLGRIPIESLRTDSVQCFGLPAATIASIISLTASLLALLFVWRKKAATA